MNLYVLPITEANRQEALNLKPAPGQDGYVESVADCLKEAAGRKCWRPVGIYDENLMVGFAMYGYFWDYFPLGRVWMDRLLIDQNYQGRGYGTAAMHVLLARLDREYHRSRIYLSVVEGNAAAERLYQGLGFHRTGERDEHGEHVMQCKRRLC